jgi:uncharacterized protein (TIGR02996 family)
MSDDSRILLQVIKKHPLDDTPRLIYADWLEENGEERRAEFIRLSCAAAMTQEGTSERNELDASMNQLLAEYGERWHQPFVRLGAEAERIRYERGFPILRFYPRTLHSCLDEIVSSHPNVIGVDTHTGERDADIVREIVSSTHIAHFNLLNLTLFNMDNHNDAELARNPAISNLTHLSFNGCWISDDGATAIATSPYLANLVSLTAMLSDLSSRAAATLSAGIYSNMLSYLDFSVSGLEDDGVEMICAARTTLPTLKRLNLEYNPICRDSLLSLARASRFPGDAILNFKKLGEDGFIGTFAELRSLIGTPNFPGYPNPTHRRGRG